MDKNKVYLYPWKYNNTTHRWSRDQFPSGREYCVVNLCQDGFWRNYYDGGCYLTAKEAMLARDLIFEIASYQSFFPRAMFISEDEVERYKALETLA